MGTSPHEKGQIMPSITVKNVTKVYVHKPVLQGVSLTLNAGDKIALVGENGAGKTTLLRILADEEEPTTGTVIADDHLPRIYMSQDFSGDPEETVASFFGSEKAQRSALRYLGELDISPEIMTLQTGVLSGGQKKIVQLIQALVSKSPYLLLDEPENHLDYFAREWLIEALRNYRGCVAFVSHDQFVIDQVANRIVQLEDGVLTSYQGSYQAFIAERQRQLEGRMQQWRHKEREIERHKEMVKRLQRYAKRNSEVAGAYRNKVRQLNRLVAARTDRPQLERKKMKLDIHQAERKGGKRMLVLEDLTLSVGGTLLFKDAKALLLNGEKVCLLGRNGSGKTSLFNLIRGELEPDKGEVKLGTNIKVGFFSQEHYEELDPDTTPLAMMSRIVLGGEQKVRSVLSNFLIDSSIASRQISTLSGGQKTRLRFAKLFSGEVELLLLDEPTNHLDTLSWEVLAEALAAFPGTVLLVSHDRAFVDRTVSKLWVIDQAKIEEFPGNLSDFLDE